MTTPAYPDVWVDQDNLGAGPLLDELMRQLRERTVFLVALSKAAFASEWVRRECTWAYQLYCREPQRVVLPVVAQPIEQRDFDHLLFLEEFLGVEAPGYRPYPPQEAVARALRLLSLVPAGGPPRVVDPLPPESAPDLLARGRSLLALWRVAEALPCFERAAQLIPSDFDARFLVGYTLSQLGQHARALVAFDQALLIRPEDPTAWANKGTSYLYLERYTDALASYERALSLRSDLAGAWNGKGYALLKIGRPQEALVCADRALKLERESAETWDTKGAALNALGRYEEALRCFDRALALNPALAESHANRAVALRALGRSR
ncbi:MAG TPA: toll/interleukin-1 receptor domain-containing protein [Ktedonobacterales bacterium]